jgi:archaellum component FlaF (FlaF/FlaG flagellin family)
MSIDVEWGEPENNRLPLLWMITVIVSTAVANIFNKRFLTGTKVSIVQFSLFAYLFSLIGSIVLFFIESLVRFGSLQYSMFPFDNIVRAEECLNVLVFNALNEILTYVLMMYLAKKTYVTRASVFGIISSLYLIIEGIFTDRINGDGQGSKWYRPLGTYLEIILFFASYTLIFFERVTLKNKAKFLKIKDTVRYIKEIEPNDSNEECEKI